MTDTGRSATNRLSAPAYRESAGSHALRPPRADALSADALRPVTTFSTASRAHLRRAGPDGLDVNREKRARPIEGEMNGQSDPP